MKKFFGGLFATIGGLSTAAGWGTLATWWLWPVVAACWAFLQGFGLGKVVLVALGGLAGGVIGGVFLLLLGVILAAVGVVLLN